MRNKEKKIVILGSYNSGKTTTLESICENKAKVEYKGTTVALDYGNTIIQGDKVHLFASPGQERFKFMREILSHGLDGAILVIDNSQGVTVTDQEIMNTLNQKKVPYVIFANKQDICPLDWEVEEIPIIPTVAKEGSGIMDGLQVLLERIEKL